MPEKKKKRGSTLEWLAVHELSTLIALAVLFCSIWAFAELADEVMEGETKPLDRKILLMMREPGDLADPVGPQWFEETVRDATAMGSTTILLLLIFAAGGLLAMERKYPAAVFLLIATFGGLGLMVLLKHLFSRPRPEIVPHTSYASLAAFPSGHSMMAAVVYLTLGALMARAHPQRRVQAYLLICALVLTLMVGVSRVYLGVHWPTDVLAGWAAGAAWAVLCLLVMRWLERRGAIQTTEPTEAHEPV
jgi:undecaprenyl-diphosphatase